MVERFKNIIIYNHGMSVIEEISKLSKNGCDDALLAYICENHDEIERELDGDEYEEPKKRNYDLCINCNLEMMIDYQKLTLVCAKCGFCTYYQAYVTSYNHTMQQLRRKCVYKRSDNFKATLNQFFYSGKQFVPDDVMDAIRNEIHNRDNILYNYDIPLTIPILECILKRCKMTKYKNSIYCIFFKLSNQPFPHITAKEYNMVLNVFNVVSSIYNKHKPKGRKTFLNYPFVLKQILVMLGKIEYTKYVPPLKTHSKQKELERVWNQITNDPEWAVALQKRKII